MPIPFTVEISASHISRGLENLHASLLPGGKGYTWDCPISLALREKLGIEDICFDGEFMIGDDDTYGYASEEAEKFDQVFLMDGEPRIKAGIEQVKPCSLAFYLNEDKAHLLTK